MLRFRQSVRGALGGLPRVQNQSTKQQCADTIGESEGVVEGHANFLYGKIHASGSKKAALRGHCILMRMITTMERVIYLPYASEFVAITL